VIRCVGGDTAPDAVLVYCGDGDSALIGTAVKASDGTNVLSVGGSRGTQIVVTAKGWSPTAPHSKPDLKVTTAAIFSTSGMIIRGHT